MKHLYKTPIPSTRKGTVDRQVKSNPRNNLIHGRHRCGKGRNSRGIITARHRGGGGMLRASGVQWDLRKVDPYESYNQFDWKVRWQKEGDSLAR